MSSTPPPADLEPCALEPCELEPCDLLPVEAVEVEAVAITAAELVPASAEVLLLRTLTGAAVHGYLDQAVAEWELAHDGEHVPADMVDEATATAAAVNKLVDALFATTD